MTDYDAIPDELKERPQWLLWDSSYHTPRQPHWRGEFQDISWSDPDDWHTFEEAAEAASERESWGIGYVTAKSNTDYPRGLYGVIDIDRGVVDGDLADWVPDLERFTDASTYIEYSPSGDGLHIPFVGDVPDWWSDSQIDDHTGVDVLTNKFCTFTAHQYEQSGSAVADVDPTPWLFEAYQNIRGESPRVEAKDGQEEYDGDNDLTAEQVRDALDHVDQDLHYSDWLRVAMAVYAWDDGSQGKSIFEQWSKSNPKWDKKRGQPHIDDIWSGSPDGQISVGTLVYHAKEGGWTPPATDGGTQAAHPTPDRGPTIDDDTDADLNPLSVIERAGYEPDDVDLADLRNDEIAYTVAEMIDVSDDVHFRWVNDNTTALYAYDDGLWTPNADNRLREVLHRALRHRNSQRMASESEHAIKSRPTLKIERDRLGAPEGTVAVQNGLLDLRERTVRDLQPEDMALNRVNVEFDADADYEGTRWMQFLEESVRDGDLEKLQEYAGYTLWHHAQPFGKALFLIGPTDAGKGVFLDVLEEILGEDNVASQSLYNLMQSRFGTANLFGKMANIRNEVTAGGLKNVEAFKELTGGGDRISAEDKGKDPFKFKVTQKFLFSTNQVPSIEHADEAFFNRLLFVKFPETVPDEEQNPNLSKELLEESPAILNWMLDGLDRLLENEQFSAENDTDDKRDIIDAWGNLADRFKHNLLEVTGDTDHVVHKADLFDLFNDYGDYLDKPNDMAQSTFTKEMKSEPDISDGRSRQIDGDDDRPRVFKGVKVNADGVDEIGADMPRHDYDGEGTSGQQRF